MLLSLHWSSLIGSFLTEIYNLCKKGTNCQPCKSSRFVSFLLSLQSKHKYLLNWTRGWKDIATTQSWFQHSNPVNSTDWITLLAINLVAREMNETTKSSVPDPVSTSSHTPADFINLLNLETLNWAFLLKMMYCTTYLHFGDCSMMASWYCTMMASWSEFKHQNWAFSTIDCSFKLLSKSSAHKSWQVFDSAVTSINSNSNMINWKISWYWFLALLLTKLLRQSSTKDRSESDTWF